MVLPLRKVARPVLAWARRIREDLHRHPELGYQERRTASVVAESLRKAGVDDLRVDVGQTGVVGLLRGARPGRTVALRADMDALPIRELTGQPYASVNDGVMHACGHDGHVAVLLAAARVLAQMREGMAGNVKLIFQPAEEGGAGGKRMVEAGCLQDPEVDVIFALHARSGIRPGQIQLSLTPNVGVNGFEMIVRGKGGHGARPHDCVDPVAIGAQIITAAQTIVSREMRPDRPIVLSFCSFQAGTKNNVIPDTAKLMGTIRAVDMKDLSRVRRALGRLAGNVARSMRGEVTIHDDDLYPPVKNDARLLEVVRVVGAELLGKRNVLEAQEQRMGGEDFAFYLADQGGAPGVIFGLGVESRENLHSARFDFGSAALEPGILMMANLALASLAPVMNGK